MAMAAMAPVNAFAGNPLIPGKRDKLTSEALVQLLAEAEEREVGGGQVLPTLDGKPLVCTWKGEDGRPRWRLAWQTPESCGLKPASEVARMLEEKDNAAALSPIRAEEYDKLIYLGERESGPYFALEVAPVLLNESGSDGKAEGKEGHVDAKLLRGISRRFKSAVDGSDTTFADIRAVMTAADWTNQENMEELAMAGHARAFVEWHKQVKFCGKCGGRTVPVEAGNRRQCTECSSKSYPRIDPVVIMLVLDREGDRAVMGRQARFLPRMWSCLAGFMEPGESLEEAVCRETREEVGLEVEEVVYHSSQPWPVGFGSQSCQLMVGFFAVVTKCDITVDKRELEDARWFTREEVKAALTFTEYTERQEGAASKLYDACHGAAGGAAEGRDGSKPETPAYVPGPYAIAHHLIRTWAELGTEGVLKTSPTGTQGLLSKV